MIKKLKKNRGFVILYAVTLSAILLSIALGVANIALKEIKFSTSAKDTNEAFFAADTGIEQVLYNDKTPDTYPAGGDKVTVDIVGLGSAGQGCVIVTIDKITDPAKAVFTSKGYNNGGGGGANCQPSVNAVERELEVTY